jgi:hypothetical protein
MVLCEGRSPKILRWQLSSAGRFPGRSVQREAPHLPEAIPNTAAAKSILARRLVNCGAFLFPCETDATRPLPGIQSAHARALRESKSGSFSSLRLSPHVGYPRRRSWNRPRDASGDARPLKDQHGSPIRPSVARAPDEGDGQDGTVRQRTEDCPRGAHSAAIVIRCSVGAEQCKRTQKSAALATFSATVARAALSQNRHKLLKTHGAPGGN